MKYVISAYQQQKSGWTQLLINLIKDKDSKQFLITKKFVSDIWKLMYKNQKSRKHRLQNTISSANLYKKLKFPRETSFSKQFSDNIFALFDFCHKSHQLNINDKQFIWASRDFQFFIKQLLTKNLKFFVKADAKLLKKCLKSIGIDLHKKKAIVRKFPIISIFVSKII